MSISIISSSIVRYAEHQIAGGIHPEEYKTLSSQKNISRLTSVNREQEFSAIIDWQNTDQRLLIDRVKQAGIVGLGGASFPTHIKLNGSYQQVHTLIVNAMECEPYITCDDRLLREYSFEVLQGAIITAKMAGANKILFGIEDNKPEAINALALEIEKNINLIETLKLKKIEIIVAKTKYPSGGEKQLIELLTGQQVPQKTYPVSLGILVQNVATLFAVHDAVINGKKLTHRLVTITGDLVENSGNYWIDFKTPLSKIISQLNIQLSDYYEIIFGGPLMGSKISHSPQDNNTHLNNQTKTSTNCIIINKKELSNNASDNLTTPHASCIRCGECQTACPVSLIPQQLYWFSQSEQWQQLKEYNLLDCIECGACSYVCPSEIPLVDYYRFAKAEIIHIENKQTKSDHAKQRFEKREQRLEKIKAERDLKRIKNAAARKAASKKQENDPDGKISAIEAALQRVKKKKEDVL